MKRSHFNKTHLATCLSVAMGASMIGQVNAQEAETAEENLEVISVSGIRGSMIKASDIKRGADGVVDAISAEDIGKFPDTNLAESLQRITGIAIDRVNGEGSKVTARGFGPDYNLVTLNGRQMPASGILPTSASGSRAFDFANLASEGVAGVEVFKTSKASIATGGIGSTINILTTKPLNAPGQKATFGVKAVNDTSAEDSTLTPELSGLYSNTFADDTIGIAISGSFQNRESGNATAHVENGWRVPMAPGGWGGIPDDPAHVNFPGEGVTYAIPQNMLYRFEQQERTRTNGQLTLQYRPMENLTATYDYTYAQNKYEVSQNISSVWMNFGHVASEWTDVNSDGVTAPLWIKENNTGVNEDNGELGFSDLVSQVSQSASNNELKSHGINLEYQASDNLSLEFDYHSSVSETGPDSKYGNSNTIQMAAYSRATTMIDFRSDFPVVTVEFPSEMNLADFDGATSNPQANVSGLSPEGVVTTGTSFRNSFMRSEVDQMQLSGTYTFDEGVVESVNFGIAQTDVDNRNAFAEAQRPFWGGVGSPDDVDDALLTASESTIIDRFGNMPGDKTGMLNAFYAPNFQDIADLVSDKYGEANNPAQWPCGVQICAPTEYTTDRRTSESSFSAYAQANLALEVASKPVDIVAGLRYEETDVTSTTLLPTVQKVEWVAENEFAITRNPEQVFFEGTGSYDYLLPSIDVKIELTDDIVGRVSFSESLTRPGYGNLTAGRRLDEVRVTGGKASKGNPGLLPIESTNFDVSFEWYYGEGSYASVGYFSKDVKNFISTAFVTETFDVYSPQAGARFDEAVAASGGDASASAAIRAKLVELNPNDPYITPAGGDVLNDIIEGSPTDNALLSAEVSVPSNADENSADGWELAVQHIFGDTGFGLQANTTIVDSDLEFDNANYSGGQTPLLGLSDTRNLVAFYDKDGVQVRLAYNWRGAFLAADTDAAGANPIYTDEYEQLDLNASYDFSDNLTIFIEAINLTDEYWRQYNRHPQMTHQIMQTGARYNIGARYSF